MEGICDRSGVFLFQTQMYVISIYPGCLIFSSLSSYLTLSSSLYFSLTLYICVSLSPLYTLSLLYFSLIHSNNSLTKCNNFYWRHSYMQRQYKGIAGSLNDQE